MTRAVALVAGLTGALLVQTIVDAPAPASARAGPPAGHAAQSLYPLPPLPVPPIDSTPVTPPPMMTPFPVVRIAGRATPRGARIRILSVRAPADATVVVRCRRRGCSRTSLRRGGGIRRAVRFRRFERPLRAGTILDVYVGGHDVIGKYTRFRIRRRRPPARLDLCLLPGEKRGSPCPDG